MTNIGLVNCPVHSDYRYRQWNNNEDADAVGISFDDRHWEGLQRSGFHCLVLHLLFIVTVSCAVSNK